MHGTTTGGPSSTGTQKANAFDETFLTNQLGWLDGVNETGHLTTSIQPDNYLLKTDNTGDTFFPYPQNVNALPTSFTLTAHLKQLQGTTDRYYGITFYFKSDNQTVTTYAFLITSAGHYALLKYAGKTTVQNVGPSGTSPKIAGLGKENTLVASVAKGEITCSVNGTVVGNAPAPLDPMFNAGTVGLLVTGPNTTFSISEFRLDR